MNAPFKPPRLLRKKRAYLEHVLQRHLDAAEALIAEIDEIDGDWDLEPSYGSVGGFSPAFNQVRWAQGASDGREEVCEDEGVVTGDDEPWLGRPETGHGASQGFGGGGVILDGEVLHNAEWTFSEVR